jgi:hypothetical protein
MQHKDSIPIRLQEAEKKKAAERDRAAPRVICVYECVAAPRVICVYECVCERERESARVCVCVCVCARAPVAVRLAVSVGKGTESNGAAALLPADRTLPQLFACNMHPFN